MHTINLPVIYQLFFLEFAAFCVFAVCLYFLQPIYQKRDLTIVPVTLGVLMVGATMMAIARNVPVPLMWNEYEYLTVIAFTIALIPCAIQQAIRLVVNWRRSQTIE